MNISKFANNPKKPFHSSGYAKIASGNNIGSTSNQTFAQRQQIEKNRTAIRKYRDSLVAHGHRHHLRDVPVDTVKPVGRDRLQVANRQTTNATHQNAPPSIIPKESTTRASFNEPSPRGYNPYG